MKRSVAISCGFLFGAFILGACSAGTGPVGTEPYGHRELVAVARDNQGIDRDMQGKAPGAAQSEKTPTPKSSATASGSSPSTPPGNNPGTNPGTNPSTTCPKCGPYACNGTVNNMTVQVNLDLQSASGGGCSDENTKTKLTCDGKLTSDGVPGTWKTSGTALTLTGETFSLGCVPK